MLIESLCEYDNYLMSEKADEMVPEGFSKQAVHFEILLDPDGKIHGIADLRELKEIPIKKDKTKEKKVPIDEQLPLRTQKTAICSNIIEHRSAYIFGLGIVEGKLSAEVPKAQKSHAAFVDCNKEFFENIDSDLCRAYYKFVTEWNPEEETENPYLVKLGKDFASSYYCFGLSGKPGEKLHEDKAFLERYNEYLEQQKAEQSKAKSDNVAFCPIEGKELPMARTHNKITGLAGGNSVGCSLVCVNETAFESYGKTQSYNSNISEEAMKKYTHSLNYLLKSENHRIVLDDLTVIFYAMKKDDSTECKQFKGFIADSAEEAQENLRDAYKFAKDGIAADMDNFDYDVMFYVAGLTPNSSRISQKFVYRDKFGKIIENLSKHQRDISIGNNTRQIYFSRIKKELTPPDTKQKVPPPLMTGIMKAALM
ncbi:MAG: type I-C CRISPR-associated protein Cas8c/Csd1, partial [Oscillospiraceae bacterium]